jgi:hypothetical protein
LKGKEEGKGEGENKGREDTCAPEVQPGTETKADERCGLNGRHTTIEIRSPTINPTTQLDAACHTDSRRVCGETPSGISMYS